MRPRRVNTGQTSQSETVPAPIGGLNGRDPLASMSATDAYMLDNMFPGTASVDSRKGCVKYSTASLGAPPQTLEVYAGPTGDVMLAWAGGKIFNVSTPVASELASGLTSNYAITTMFSNAADTAQHLIIVTGYDQPRRYTTSGLATLTMTGMTGSQNTLNFVKGFKSRLYFGQRDKLGFYYLPVGQIQGALSYFDLGQVSAKGGYLVAIATFTESGSGTTPNDYIVFITNKGECIVYAGFDPSNAANWGLVGRYYAAPPIGARCTLNYGTELIILTQEGAVPFSEVRRAGDAQSNGVQGAAFSAITSKLGSFLSDLNVNADVPGWEGVQYSAAGWLLLNVPATQAISGAYYQYVMNTTTGAWCRFTNWNGLCFCVYNKKLYFGRFDGYIMQGDESRLDDGSEIRVDVKQAYNYFGAGDNAVSFSFKHFQWASLLLSCDGTPPLSGRFNADFKEEQPQYVNALEASGGSPWDTTAWDEGLWGDDGRAQNFLITLNKGGRAGALWLRGSLAGVSLSWYATQYVFGKSTNMLI